jgi:pyridinium-3,5-biscarboxylic acid mononucleotide sulfurtransferase
MKDKRFQNLLDILKEMQSVLLAYSGGVDSTFLLKAIQVSGISALSVTASSELIPYRDVLIAQGLAEGLGIEHKIINTDILLMDDFVSNTPERCFFCKNALYKELQALALTEGYRFILDGSTLDDINDFRPGRKAAQHYHVRSPLIEADLSKGDVRELSQQFGLATWDKPSSPCLATRFPYGRRITKEALNRVEMAENFLKSLGFNELRVRDHDSVARIEVKKEDIDLVLDHEKRDIISATLKSLGYAFISLDLDGYQSGSMNRVLKNNT